MTNRKHNIVIEWMPKALDDLEAFGAYVSRDDRRVAGVMVLRVLAEVQRLGQFPASGRVVGTRELVVPYVPLIIPYRVKGEVLQILRVQHTSMDWGNV